MGDDGKDTEITCQDGKKHSFFSSLLRQKSKVFNEALEGETRSGKFTLNIDAPSDIVDIFLSSLSDGLVLRKVPSEQLEALLGLFHEYDVKDHEDFCVELIISRMEKPESSAASVELFSKKIKPELACDHSCSHCRSTYIHATAVFPRCQSKSDATTYYRYASLGIRYHHTTLVEAALDAIATPKKSDFDILEAIEAPLALYKEILKREIGARLETPDDVTMKIM
eukprot:gb/GEZN01010916.1/.p1 GENE.gb/GEZN01010916.1/~~gb/GEZN01010916.1/.p1  ORF type:complete len:225 (+),score=23.47 gb/GEZN01010916.1/:64-738(+)